jgi:UDP-N-acetylmuramate--alanine ligase
LLHSAGNAVSGSDQSRSPITDRLASLGIAMQYHHQPELIADAEMAVYSSAIKPDNAERAYARKHNIAQIRRAEILGEIMLRKYSIGVAGTHGKTTTTALVGHILEHAGRSPTVLAGGTLRRYGSNAVAGTGDILVTEADEYDRSFLAMHPALAIITNVEADHLECYGSLAAIEKAFAEYAHRTPVQGSVIMCGDDSGAVRIMPRIERNTIVYGIGEKADLRAVEISFEGQGARFCVERKGLKLGMASLPMTGMHAIRNALAAIAAALELNISFAAIAESLQSFSGVKRRFEIAGKANNVTVIDDYAHHPTEITATIDSARNAGFKRVIAVFQPHLYTRTRDFANAFAKSLSSADWCVVSEIYKSREEPIEGVTGENIIQIMHAAGNTDAVYIPEMHAIPAMLNSRLEEGDAVLLMGAGDINAIASAILKEIANG